MTPNEFPYIKAIHVNDCFAYQNFDINLPPLNGKPFSHLILTGKNGSGKTTILRGVEYHIGVILFRHDPSNNHYIERHDLLRLMKVHKSQLPELNKLKDKFNWYESIGKIDFLDKKTLMDFKGKSIFSFFEINRLINSQVVSTPTPETEFLDKLTSSESTAYFTQKFKQYLVNKKVQQAFYQINNNTEGVKVVEQFFENFLKILKRLFEDDDLNLIFESKNYEFYINLNNKRRITFNQLPAGFSAFINILADLLIRVDLIRAVIEDYSFDPCGIVILDEPEMHFHIEAQYDVLPILTEFFPNVQFIVATHSPAVISSIKNTTVFDLTSKRTVTDRIVGSSYSELMVSHFGLDNEFSPIADKIMDDIKTVKKEFKNNKPVLKEKLSAILMENEEYLSPVLQLELNSLILETTF